jgi:predicted ATP-grasp superfamily ATP-dependent carboligase
MNKVSASRTKSAPLGGDRGWVVLGYSARSLAEATSQLGMRAVAVDHFADHDCQLHAECCIRVPRWGNAGQAKLSEQDRHFKWMLRVEELLGPQARVLLGGGTENWPECVKRLHERFVVLGPTSRQLATLRCREFWHRLADASAVRFPESRSTLSLPVSHSSLSDSSVSNSSVSGESWIRKPVSGAGGLGVRRIDANAKAEAATYFQREIVGRVLGAHCVLFEQSSLLLGVTESFSAADWPGPSAFIYRGSWGPVAIEPDQRARIVAICETVRMETGLRGWLQIDLIEDDVGDLWLLELNPRWAAGMEALYLSGINAVEPHLQAWERSTPIRDGADTVRPEADRVGAKAVVYADRDIELTASLLAALQATSLNDVADVPARSMIGETIRVGHPLLTDRTTMTTGQSHWSLRLQVLHRLHELRGTILGLQAH